MRKVTAKLDRKWFAQSLKRCGKTLLKQSGACRKRPSAEAVHQLRVASRRLLAQLQILDTVFPEVDTAKAEQFLKRLRKQLGKLRDTQVQKEILEDWPGRIQGLRAIRLYLELREDRLLKLAGREIKDLKFNKLRKCLTRIKGKLRTRLKPPARIDLTIQVRSCIDKTFTQTVRRIRAIDYACPETIHRTRVAFKKFRYTLETLPDTFTGLTWKKKKKLSIYQDRMGKIQDLEVLRRMITAFEEVHPGHAESMGRFRSQLEAQHAKALATFKRSAGDLFAFWPRNL